MIGLDTSRIDDERIKYASVTGVAERRRTSVMKPNQSLVQKGGRSSGMGIWSIIGGVALAAVAALVIVSIPDIKRYIKISTM